MKIALGSDEKTHLTDHLITELEKRGHTLTLFGPLTETDTYWPAVAQQVAEAVITNQADEGIILCWTGTGVTIAANKLPGIRAALCDDAETARGARLWNNANVLTLSLRRTTPIIASEILDAWFAHTYQPNETDDTCLGQLATIEEKYRA
ncbi:MAG TPA: RpiB/LacA/LacB family sugar-phosphate isomerase [Anaerolineae bacterium]|nr:RpiB/LacA/LacB family sugar-phosphate isomerase [Anaerolineae bacterium]